MGLFLRWFDRLEVLSLRLSQVALVIMMLLTTSDAVSRYIFNQSIVGAYEITEMYVMVALVFLSMSFVKKVDGHIRLDILFEKFPIKVQHFLDAFYSLLAAAMFFFIGLRGLNMTLEAIQYQYVAAGLINLPLWLSYIWLPIGSFLFVIRLLISSIRLILFRNKTTLKGEIL
ncbi:TRAP transporter small permease [Oceanobacillus polygoni]|uniref:TRAP-type C4-dicarboxylate transport system permease small subunit n=1 Tax=Oceanobacillus polygoni TaxID=1235259 RepID=A0A9X0YRW5_9BACI|nr:TRAP transporter small permease [Oceanobacillus polygoni]MBP2075856.1 TRAP-type C4-dicarboxylate transport system permease small subunit [Oceanobacillus polygoni]